MTRSQQELRFESGTAESYTSEELAEQGLETLNASPSRVLQRQSLLIRQSKGNPLYAKPVGIPVVPELPKTTQPLATAQNPSQDSLVNKPIMESNSRPPVSPHKINNFVYEEDNRIILDFGPSANEASEDHHRTDSPSSESSKSSSGTYLTLKYTLSQLLANFLKFDTFFREVTVFVTCFECMLTYSVSKSDLTNFLFCRSFGQNESYQSQLEKVIVKRVQSWRNAST